jgi:hypothetical protein
MAGRADHDTCGEDEGKILEFGSIKVKEWNRFKK